MPTLANTVYTQMMRNTHAPTNVTAAESMLYPRPRFTPDMAAIVPSSEYVTQTIIIRVNAACSSASLEV